jgi:hypothetical protein
MKYACLILLCLLCSFISRAQTDSTAQAPPDTVTVGAYIISVHDINFHDKEYTMRFWLWFLHDNPDFDFSRQLDIPNAKTIDEPEIILDSMQGKAWVIMKMKCTMKENWNVEDFPFDQQHLKVEIENTLFDKSSLVFVPDIAGSKINGKDGIDGWTIRNFRVNSKENHYETGFGDLRPGHESSTFSQFTIELDIERNAWGLFLKIFVGMYIAFMISMISFAPKPSEVEPRFGLPVGALFAAVGNKYIIDSILPQASSFTLVDTLHSLTFLSIFATLLISTYVLTLHDKGREEEAKRINKTWAAIVGFGYVIGNAIAIVVAIS